MQLWSWIFLKHLTTFQATNFYALAFTVGSAHGGKVSFLLESSLLQLTSNLNPSSAYVTSGIPQGIMLGPLLFLIHINDLPYCLSSQVHPSSDDVIHCSISSGTGCKSSSLTLMQLTYGAPKWLVSPL